MSQKQKAEIQQAIAERDAIWREHMKDLIRYLAGEVNSISFLVFRATNELMERDKEIRATMERKFNVLKAMSGVDPSQWYLHMRTNPATADYTLEEAKRWLQRAADAAKNWTEAGVAELSDASKKGRKRPCRPQKKKR